MAQKDLYSQIAYVATTESAANTLTFNGLTVATNVLQQSGMIIHRVEYALSTAGIANITAAGDSIEFGLSGSDSLSSISLADPEVYDDNRLLYHALGAPASGSIQRFPLVKDLSTLPGGGRLVPADRVYLYVVGVSLAAAVSVNARIHFTIVDLDASGYLELAQSLRVLK